MAHKGKKALITGASAGFGTFLARTFAAAGYQLILSGRNADRLGALQEEIAAAVPGSRPTVIAGDLSSPTDLDTLQRSLKEEAIDVLVNNAGINPETHRRNTPSDIADINAVLATNTAAAIALAFASFAHFSSKGGGYIININSSSGKIGSNHEPVYAASKFGMRGFFESVKDAWLKEGVRVIDVYPSAIAVGFASARPNVGDLIEPQELADFIVGLCDTNSFFVREVGLQRIDKIKRNV